MSSNKLYRTVNLSVVSTPNTVLAYMLVDLSNTAYWKHKETGKISVHSVGLSIDPVTTFVGNIGFGILSNVDATNGDFNQLGNLAITKDSNLFAAQLPMATPGIAIELDHHVGPIIANSVLFQTDTNLGGPDAPGTPTYPAGNGDLVMIVTGNNKAISLNVNVTYSTLA